LDEGRNMQIKLMFDNWMELGVIPVRPSKYLELSTGDFHSGTTFDGTITLDPEQEAELQVALGAGYKPRFILY
jgi:hypothetical protein